MKGIEMGRVFVVQEPMKWDKGTRSLISKFDIGPALEHGSIVHLLDFQASPFDPEPVIERLDHLLADFGDDDCLLLTGNPCFIGWAVAIAADVNGGRVRMLQWSGKDGRYLPIESQIFEDEEYPELPNEL